MLTNEERKQLLQRYSSRLRRYGPSPEALGWSKPKHNLRYRILLDYWSNSQPLIAPHVLDFGCGFGDLFGYARAHNIRINYTGIDINPDLIAVARVRYPEARFLSSNSELESFNEKFDIIVASGIHNHLISDNASYINETINLFDRISRVGFSLNFLSNKVNFRREENYYASAQEILGLALQYSSRVVLRHDYMPFEFTVHVDKRNHFNAELTVFEPFVDDCKS